jgi:DNA-binding LytR/AlgR family response regulator
VTPLRALILEDERAARSYLVELVESLGIARVEAAVSDPDEAQFVLTSGVELDVAFVDVHLVGAERAETAGLDFVRSARARPRCPHFVLTTASRDHALAAFDLGIVDYLLKPFTKERVREALLRVRAARPQGLPTTAAEERRVVARRQRSLRFLRESEVWAFEAEGRLSFVHTAEGRLDLDLSLTALEAAFGASFVRVHRSWLVAMKHVRELTRDGGEVTLALGEAGKLRVPVARDRLAFVKERLLEVSIGVGRED